MMTRSWVGLVLALGCGGSSVALPSSNEPSARPRVAVALRFVEAPAGEAAEPPRTRVLLVVIREGEPKQTEHLGTFDGACMHSPVPGPVVLSARCWWAGAGAAVQVVREEDLLLARVREVDEMTGEGPWREATRVELPERTELDVVRPETLPVE